MTSEKKAGLPSLEVAQAPSTSFSKETVFDIKDLSVRYGKALAVEGVSLEIYRNAITALIGPSGCGKSTFLRCMNRMNDLVAEREGRGEPDLQRH